jgi:hypothetical protein
MVVSTICTAQDKDSLSLKFSGWGMFTAGRVESTMKDNPGSAVKDYNFEKEWLVDFDMGFKCVANLGKGLKVRTHLGLTTAYMICDDETFNSTEYEMRRTVPYMIDAAIEKTYKSGDNCFFGEFGFFPVKYNPDARNLGEYLFRSGTYYGTINSGFEMADKEKLTGLHGKFTHNITEKSNLQGDLFFTSDMRDYPVHDFSLSYILGANLANIFQVSAGLMHAHMIPVDRRKTTPFYDEVLFNKSYRRLNDACTPDYPDTGDTVIYTFQGTKAMGRLAFDPKQIFGNGDGEGFLGKEDLKLYCEAAILGLKNYPIWYENRADRMPVMFGINWFTNQFASYCIIPGVLAYALEPISANKGKRTVRLGTAGIITGVGTWLLDHFLQTNTRADVISIEVEHNPSPFLNTSEAAWKFRSPLPYVGHGSRYPFDLPEKITNDDWKWSVYYSKKFGHFRLSGQVASDHFIRRMYMVGPPTNSKYTEVCPRTWDWYWMTRVMYFF